MTGTLATFDVETEGCPGTTALREGGLSCMALGGGYGPVGILEGPVPEGWTAVTSCGRGQIVRGPGGPCADCPLSKLPAGVLPLSAHVRPGRVRVDVACDRRDGLRAVVEGLRARGARPTLVRVRSPHRVAERPLLVDLALLTPRQAEALRVAESLDYFRTGKADVRRLAEAMGCSRSTAHEHLRKGLDRLLRSVLPGL